MCFGCLYGPGVFTEYFQPENKSISLEIFLVFLLWTISSYSFSLFCPFWNSVYQTMEFSLINWFSKFSNFFSLSLYGYSSFWLTSFKKEFRLGIQLWCSYLASMRSSEPSYFFSSFTGIFFIFRALCLSIFIASFLVLGCNVLCSMFF